MFTRGFPAQGGNVADSWPGRLMWSQMLHNMLISCLHFAPSLLSMRGRVYKHAKAGRRCLQNLAGFKILLITESLHCFPDYKLFHLHTLNWVQCICWGPQSRTADALLGKHIRALSPQNDICNVDVGVLRLLLCRTSVLLFLFVWIDIATKVFVAITQ